MVLLELALTQCRLPAENSAVHRPVPRHHGGNMLKLYGQYRSRAFRVAWLCK
jgi:hypothetical protein